MLIIAFEDPLFVFLLCRCAYNGQKNETIFLLFRLLSSAPFPPKERINSLFLLSRDTYCCVLTPIVCSSIAQASIAMRAHSRYDDLSQS